MYKQTIVLTIMLFLSSIGIAEDTQKSSKNYDSKGIISFVNVEQRLLSINDQIYQISYKLKVYNESGRETSLLNLKNGTPVGIVYSKEQPGILGELWILTDSEEITPPG